jgi:hypothetical protein
MNLAHVSASLALGLAEATKTTTESPESAQTTEAAKASETIAETVALLIPTTLSEAGVEVIFGDDFRGLAV